jgi:hypothetical protein
MASAEYERGWKANNQLRADRRELQNAGGFSRLFGIFFCMVGFIALSQVPILAYTTGWSKLRHPFMEYYTVISFLIMIAGIPLQLRARRIYNEAKVAFKAKWPDQEP